MYLVLFPQLSPLAPRMFFGVKEFNVLFFFVDALVFCRWALLLLIIYSNHPQYKAALWKNLAQNV